MADDCLLPQYSGRPYMGTSEPFQATISNVRLLVKPHSALLPSDIEINEIFCQINSEHLLLSPASGKICSLTPFYPLFFSKTVSGFDPAESDRPAGY